MVCLGVTGSTCSALCSTAPVTFTLPVAPPEAPGRTPVPFIPLIAPVVLSLVMAVVFSAPLALMMGALGPLMVFGSWWESRRSARSQHRREVVAYQEACEEQEHLLSTLRMSERKRAHRALPSVPDWLSDPLWRWQHGEKSLCRVGTGWCEPPEGHPLAQSGAYAGMPVSVEASLGLALVAGEEGAGVWRAMVLQWMALAGVESIQPRIQSDGEQVPRDIRGLSRLVWVERLSDVPPECAAVVISSPGVQGTLRLAQEEPRQIQLDVLSHAGSLQALVKLGAVPQLGQSRQPPDFRRRDQLWCELSTDEAPIDLVQEGPHTVVWGATGSGKSVTVLSVVLSIARNYSPTEVVCVVVDFKGGAGLRPLENLPHTIGVVTDLEHSRSKRAVQGLQAEMVARERLLATHQVAETSQLPNTVVMPRLLVVIDEAAWLFANHPEWADALSDILARGRSLGVHVIVSSQRIAGVFSRGMMANVALRLCGRVSDDSEVVDGITESTATQRTAARHFRQGNILVQGAQLSPRIVQVSLPTTDSDPGTDERSSWRVWCEDLPKNIPYQPGLWAMEDRPDTQEQVPARYPPEGEGSVAIVGDSGMGKTSASHALASVSPGSILAPRDPAGLFECLETVSGTHAIVVIDDVDLLIHSSGQEGETFLLELLEAFIGTLIMTMGPSHRLARSVVRLTSRELILPMTKAEDVDRWGASSRLVPGRGMWQKREIQVVSGSPPIGEWQATRLLPGEREIVVLSSDTEAWQDTKTTWLGTAHQMMATWHTLVDRLAGTDVLIDAVSSRETRQVTSGRVLVPPLEAGHGYLWLWRNGSAHRIRKADWQR